MSSKSKIDQDEPLEKLKNATLTLAKNQEDLHAQAERLNRCIERFEEWVAQLPGRVETQIQIPIKYASHEELAPEYCYILRVARAGKEWHVSWCLWEVGSDDETWKRLREASLDVKIDLVPKLPRIIIQMVEQQEALRKRIVDAANVFDFVARSMGINREEK